MGKKKLTPKKRRLSTYYVMQECNYQLFTESVSKELLIGAKNSIANQKKADYILARLELSDLKNQHPNLLSGGQKQRLSIAVSYMQERNIVCFDEPTSGLDYSNMMNVKNLIHNMAQSGKGIIVISHDYEFLANSCTHILEMHDKAAPHLYALNESTSEKLYNNFKPYIPKNPKEVLQC